MRNNFVDNFKNFLQACVVSAKRRFLWESFQRLEQIILIVQNSIYLIEQLFRVCLIC